MVSRSETAADASPGRSESARAAAVLISAAHLTVLTSFAVAQPLFDLLGKNAAFFAARASPPSEIVAFALAVTFGLPAALVFVELVGGLIDPAVRTGVHLASTGFLAAVLALGALASRTDIRAAVLIPLALLLGGAFAGAYRRVGAVRSFLTILTPAPFVFLGLFLFTGQVSKLVLPGEARAATVVVEKPAPVVLVIFDEFPVVSLMDGKERIDRVRYPNFAALADDSIWFRNATGVSDFTTWAGPAILSGKYPEHDQLPIASDYPRTVFTLLGATYDIAAFMPFPQLCPPSLCDSTEDEPPASDRARSLLSDVSVVYGHLLLPRDLREDLPSLEGTWRNFRGDQGTAGRQRPTGDRPTRRKLTAALVAYRDERVQVFERFMASLTTDPERTLRVLHILYPHYPWDRLPSGKYYRVERGGVGISNGPEELVRQAWQRHLLQVGFTDRLVGQIVRRLKQVGMYERSLVIFTADHGATFRRGRHFRLFHPESASDILFVPLFVKLPNEDLGGTTDDRHVQTIDILPTIANVLGADVPWPLDGRSLLDGGTDRVYLVSRNGRVWNGQIEQLKGQRRELAARQAEVFGSGRDWSGLFGIGPNPQLIGQPPSRYPTVAAGNMSAEFDRPADLRAVDLSGPQIPALVTGTIDVEFATGPFDLALSLNRRIVEVAESFRKPGENQDRFSFVVPESAFRNGANEARVYRVQREGVTLTLTQLACTGCE